MIIVVTIASALAGVVVGPLDAQCDHPLRHPHQRRRQQT